MHNEAKRILVTGGGPGLLALIYVSGSSRRVTKSSGLMTPFQAPGATSTICLISSNSSSCGTT
jgi:hypothetical protein